MRKFLTLILLFFIGLAIVDGATPPSRIISLAPSLTKSIYYLQADNLLIGHTSFCYIAQNDNKEVIASAVSVNIEKVITLKPDLVITTAMTNPETIDILRRAGIRTEVFQTPRSFEEVCIQFLQVGRMIGKETLANEIVDEAKNRIGQIKQSNLFRNPPAFFFQIGAKPLFTVLDNTFMNDYITLSGGRNIASGFTRGTISREYVLMNNPDVIIIVNMGITGDEEKKIWESYKYLNAVKNKRVFFIESDMASNPNPPDFLKTMETINQILGENWWQD